MLDEIRISIDESGYKTAKKLYEIISKNDSNKKVTISGTLEQWKKLLKEYRNEVIDEIIEQIGMTH